MNTITTNLSNLSLNEPSKFIPETIESTNVVKSYKNTFNMYAETDLDQPTDYSLRYAEDDSDSEVCEKISNNEPTEFVQDTLKTYCTEDTPYETPCSFSGNPSVTPSVADFPAQKPETKVVKFEEVVNYAEETPLIFSRSSSLASLDSIEQHSIHDDISSVVSDFSRLTSGLVSPSELPDSPTQTIPSSPKPRKNSAAYQSKVKNCANSVPNTSNNDNKSTSVFEDVVKKFKLESTPVQFSTATSLSSLLIDDHDEPDSKNTTENENKEEIEEEKIEIPVVDDNPVIISSDSSEDEEDEDMLAACINIGIKNNKYNQFRTNTPPEVNEPPSCYNFEDAPEIIDNPVPTPRDSLESVPNLSKTEEDIETTTDQITKTVEIQPLTPNNICSTDTMKTYCTEDTPALLSHAGSNSDLSNLSIAGGSIDNKTKDNDYLSDINSMSDDNEDSVLLAECIQSGMPQDNKVEINKLSEAEQAVLEQCIFDGIRKNNINVVNHLPDTLVNINNESSELTEVEQALLKQCILSGMPKNNSKSMGTVASTTVPPPLPPRTASLPRTAPPATRTEIVVDSSELTEADKTLLEQCILDGMPKNKNYDLNSYANTSNKPVNLIEKQIYKKINDVIVRRHVPSVEPVQHTCCIHCPKNKQLTVQQTRQSVSSSGSSTSRIRRTNRSQERYQVRDSGEINIFYMTRQILALKKEIVDRSHEEWV